VVQAAQHRFRAHERTRRQPMAGCGPRKRRRCSWRVWYLSSANIQVDITRWIHAEQLRARSRRGKRVFVMQPTKDRFYENERALRQAMAGF